MSIYKLEIAEKTVNDVVVGYLVGHSTYNYRNGNGFRRLRRDTTFDTFKEAKKYKNKIEEQIKEIDFRVRYNIVE